MAPPLRQPAVFATNPDKSSRKTLKGCPMRFIILCAARTGSTMLRFLLNSHPEIVCHGEVMTGTGFVGLAPGPSPIRTKLERLRDADPVRFMREFVLYGEDVAGAVGFKIKYEELSRPEFSPILEDLLADKDLRVIHLRRRNRFERLVSLAVAHRVGLNLIFSEDQRPAVPSFHLSPAQCEADFAEVEARETEFAARFGDHPLIETTYEDILAGDDLTRVQEFLGVRPALLQPSTLKIVDKSVKDLVENYSELRAAFAGTAHERFFPV
jgi:LPS sulfotransferase NodH